MNFLGQLCSCQSNDLPKTAKGVSILDVDDGQPCSTCTKDKCPGFSQHSWRSICIHCKCSRNSHDVVQSDTVTDVRERLGWDSPKDPSLQPNKEKAFKLGYTWIPAGLSKLKVEDYMKQLDSEKTPKVATTGATYRDRQLTVQLPPHDLSPKFCRFLCDKEEYEAFDEFCRIRDAEAMDIGYIANNGAKESAKCRGCEETIEKGDLAVLAPRIGTGIILWHPACFICTTCKELLVDLCYCLKDGVIYCERHYAELIRPRCAACDELVFSKDPTKAMSRTWHQGHFTCFKCDKELAGCRYLVQNGNSFCVECYESLYSSTCKQCNELISIRDKDLVHKEMHWHEKCFHCCDCNKSLVEQQFAMQDDRLYCSECHDNKFAPRCDHCKGIFKGGMKKFEFNGRKWHADCFRCDDCHKPIEDKSFVPQDEKAICVACFERNYAPKCTKCNGPISKSGITYKDLPWHRDCFTCSHCDKVLSGDKFTTHEDKPYCGDCYAREFAKKCTECTNSMATTQKYDCCTECTRPITGLGTTKFVSYEDKHWHTECFICSMCRLSLAGKGFLLNDSGAILCPECDQ